MKIKITIKQMSIWLASLAIVITSLLVVHVKNLDQIGQNLEQFERNRFDMIFTINHFRQRADNQTRLAKMYVSTSDGQYKSDYFNRVETEELITPQQTGSQTTTENSNSKQNLPSLQANDKSPFFQQHTTQPYLDTESEKLSQAVSIQEQVASLELKAIQLLDGASQETKEAQSALALQLLNSTAYIESRHSLNRLIEEVLASVSLRTSEKEQMLNTEMDETIFIIYILLASGFGLCALSAFIVYKRFLTPVEALTQTINAYRKGSNNITEKVYYDDEIGLMTAQFFEMKHNMSNDLVRLNLAFSAANQCWFDYNLLSNKITVSDEYYNLFGHDENDHEETLDYWVKSTHWANRQSVIDNLRKISIEGGSVELEYRRLNSAGQYRWIHTQAEIVEFEDNGRPLRMTGIHMDITTRKRTELRESVRNNINQQLLKSTPLRAILDSIIEMFDGEIQVDNCGVYLMDPEAQNQLYLASTSTFSSSYKDTMSQMDLSTDTDACYQAIILGHRRIVDDIKSSACGNFCKQLAARTKFRGCWYEPILNLKGKVMGTVAIFNEDLVSHTDEEIELVAFAARLVAFSVERKLSGEKILLASQVFENSHEGIMVTDEKKRIIDINPMFSNLTGFSREEILDKTPDILNTEIYSKKFYRGIWKDVAEKGVWQGEIINYKKDGSHTTLLGRFSAIVDKDGKVKNYVGLFSDITKLKEQQKALEMMTHYDMLTQLPNRVLFNDRFLQAAAHCKRESSLIAVCEMDLDHFTDVNDKYGREVGDKVLIEVTSRIKSEIREEDTVSRYGSDVFTLLLVGVDSARHCEMLIKRIHAALTTPFFIEEHQIQISVSTGITLYPTDESNLDTLLRHANHSTYQAKSAGRNCLRFFNPGEEKQRSLRQTRLIEIEAAYQDRQFRLFFQPKVNMKTGKVFGAEALIRWVHPEKGLIMPLDFLPFIDSNPLEIKIGDWVINEALSQMAEWKQQGIELEVSANIASYHLQSDDFVEKLQAALERHPTVAPDKFQLEILESSALGDLSVIVGIIGKCHKLGVNIALDDFGTGYSSLTHLRNLPAKILKIDQSFVFDMLDNPGDYVIIDGIIRLADAFHRETIAEGVESIKHGLMLMKMGCYLAQGYVISKPIPADEFVQWYENYEPDESWMCPESSHKGVKETSKDSIRTSISKWLQRFEEQLHSLPEHDTEWPTLDTKECHCGFWIYLADAENLFDESVIKELNQAHEAFHGIAHRIHEKYHQGNVHDAKKDLDELKHVSNLVNELLVD